MDLNAHRESLLAHYIALAREPGWKAYAEQRVKQLTRDASGLYADFEQRLKAALSPTPKEKPDVVRAHRSH
jgi:hypothetical protein